MSIVKYLRSALRPGARNQSHGSSGHGVAPDPRLEPMPRRRRWQAKTRHRRPMPHYPNSRTIGGTPLGKAGTRHGGAATCGDALTSTPLPILAWRRRVGARTVAGIMTTSFVHASCHRQVKPIRGPGWERTQGKSLSGPQYVLRWVCASTYITKHQHRSDVGLYYVNQTGSN